MLSAVDRTENPRDSGVLSESEYTDERNATLKRLLQMIHER